MTHDAQKFADELFAPFEEWVEATDIDKHDAQELKVIVARMTAQAFTAGEVAGKEAGR
jgi:hypothetical protein